MQLIAGARESQDSAERMRQLNREQAARALEQREELMEQRERVRDRQLPAVRTTTRGRIRRRLDALHPMN